MSSDVFVEYGNGDNVVQTQKRRRLDEIDGFEYEAQADTGSLDEVEYKIVLRPKHGPRISAEKRTLIYVEPLFPDRSLNDIPSSYVRVGIRDKFHSKSFVKFLGIGSEDARQDAYGYSLNNDKKVFTSSVDRASTFSIITAAQNQRCLGGQNLQFSAVFQTNEFADFKIATIQSKFTADGGLLRGIVFLSALQKPSDFGVKVLAKHDPAKDCSSADCTAAEAKLEGGGAVTTDEKDAFEPNDYFDEASPLYLLGERIRLSFHTSDDTDYFVFELTSSSTIRVQAEHSNSNLVNIIARVFSSRNRVLEADKRLSDGDDELSVNIAAGTYFVQVEPDGLMPYVDEQGTYELFIDTGSSSGWGSIDRSVAAYGPYEVTIPNKGFDDTLNYAFELEKGNTEFDNRITSSKNELWKVETRLVAPSTEQHPLGVSFQDDDRFTLSFTTYNTSADCRGDRQDIFDVKILRPKEYMMLPKLDSARSYHISVTMDDTKTVFGECLPVLETVDTLQVSFSAVDSVMPKANVKSTDNQKLDVRFDYGSSPTNLDHSKRASQVDLDTYEADIETTGPLFYQVVVSIPGTKLAATALDPNEIRGDVEQAIDVVRTELAVLGENGETRLGGVVTHASSAEVVFQTSACGQLDIGIEGAKDEGNGFFSSVSVFTEPQCYRIAGSVDGIEFAGMELPVLKVQTTTVAFEEESDNRVTFQAVVDTSGHDDLFDGHIVFQYGNNRSQLEHEVQARPADTDRTFNASVEVRFEGPVFYEVVVRNPENDFSGASPTAAEVRGGIRRALKGLETLLTSYNGAGNATLRGVVTSRKKDATNVRFVYGTNADSLDKQVEAILVDSDAGLYESVEAVNAQDEPVYYALQVEANKNSFSSQPKTLSGEVLRVLTLHTLASKLNPEGNETLKGIVAGSNDIAETIVVFFEYAQTKEDLDSASSSVSPQLDVNENDRYSISIDTASAHWFRIVAKQNDKFVEIGPAMKLVDIQTLPTVRQPSDSSIRLRGFISNSESLNMQRYAVTFVADENQRGEERIAISWLSANPQNGVLLVEHEEELTPPVTYRIELQGETDFDTIQGDMLSVISVSSPHSETQRNGDVDISVVVVNNTQGIHEQTFLQLLDSRQGVISTKVAEEKENKRWGSTFSLDSPGLPLFFRVVFEDTLGQPNVSTGPWQVLAVEAVARISSIYILTDNLNAEVTLKGTIRSDFVRDANFVYGPQRSQLESPMKFSEIENRGTASHVQSVLNHSINKELFYRLNIRHNLRTGDVNVGRSNVWSVIGDFETGEKAVVPDDFERKYGPRESTDS
eukprot:gb/GECG01008674.1/.p1 GENE.gb/GECG01008674.1/~~gb/GECG01008674.1/.p1  ORF type:complete len:1304 (+),score=191.57 gb/GECG01008674.1/:1-3912(+)